MGIKHSPGCNCCGGKMVLFFDNNITSTGAVAAAAFLRNLGHTVHTDDPEDTEENQWSEDIDDYDVVFHGRSNRPSTTITPLMSTDWPGRLIMLGEAPGQTSYNAWNAYTSTTGLAATASVLFGRLADAGDPDEFNRCPIEGAHDLCDGVTYLSALSLSGVSGGNAVAYAVWERTAVGPPAVYAASSESWIRQNKVGSTDYILAQDGAWLTDSHFAAYDNALFVKNLVEKPV